MRPLKIAVDIRLLFDIDHAIIHFADHTSLEWAFMDSTFSKILEIVLKQGFQPIKCDWILNCPPHLVSPIEVTLKERGFIGEMAHLMEASHIVQYLDRCDLFLSPDSKLLYKVCERGALGGYLPLKAIHSPLHTIAFDHRIFIDGYNEPALRSWLTMIGRLQTSGKRVKAALITTNSSSVEKRVIDLFQQSECYINEIFYLAAGGKEDVYRLFGPSLYFEGRRRQEVRSMTHGRPLLFV